MTYEKTTRTTTFPANTPPKNKAPKYNPLHTYTPNNNNNLLFVVVVVGGLFSLIPQGIQLQQMPVTPLLYALLHIFCGNFLDITPPKPIKLRHAIAGHGFRDSANHWPRSNPATCRLFKIVQSQETLISHQDPK
jgi:hypothetical protein